MVERRESGWDFDDDATLDDPVQRARHTPIRRQPSQTEHTSNGAQAGDAILAELTGQENFASKQSSPEWVHSAPTLFDHIWGDIWQDGLLSRRDRSLAAMAAAGALMQVDGFAFNAAIGERNGLSRDEIVEVCVQLTVECGFPFGNLALTRVLSDWAAAGKPFTPDPAIRQR